jgi:hypothetical protein
LSFFLYAEQKVTAPEKPKKKEILPELREAKSKAVDKTPTIKAAPTEVRITSAQLSAEDIQKRKEYLCQQRDKLLKAKGGRSKLVQHAEKNQEAPQTTSEGQQDKDMTEDSELAIQLRRALVNRLKAEVINKT